MLNTKKLLAAKLDETDNFILQALWGAVRDYNGGSVATADRADILERILVGAGEWLTSHPPKNTDKNKARWDALDSLAQNVIEEGQKLGARFLTGPTDWKTISGAHGKRSYWLEMLSPMHGVGFQLSPKFETWMQYGAPGQSFWEYLNINPPYDLKLVKYYGGTAKAEKRRVRFKPDGKLYRVLDDSLFDSQHLTTAASGDGWAIFVMSLDGRIYAHKHVVGVYHHSTFLSGSAVAAAGELVVEQGVVKCITAKSGHYVPLVENMRAFVKSCPELPKLAVIMPSFATTPTPAYRVQEFKFNPDSPQELRRSQVDASLPAWAKNNLSDAMVNKVKA